MERSSSRIPSQHRTEQFHVFTDPSCMPRSRATWRKSLNTSTWHQNTSLQAFQLARRAQGSYFASMLGATSRSICSSQQGIPPLFKEFEKPRYRTSDTGKCPEVLADFLIFESEGKGFEKDNGRQSEGRAWCSFLLLSTKLRKETQSCKRGAPSLSALMSALACRRHWTLLRWQFRDAILGSRADLLKELCEIWLVKLPQGSAATKIHLILRQKCPFQTFALGKKRLTDPSTIESWCARAASSAFTTAVWPSEAAMCKAVRPCKSIAAGAAEPLSSKRTHCKCPEALAHQRAVRCPTPRWFTP